MSDADVDLEALFDEISAQSATEPAAASSASSSADSTEDSGEDNLEALFDEISAQNAAAPAADGNADTGAGAAAASPMGDAPANDSSDTPPMYERLGGIVRLLHDSMRELGYDRSLTDVAAQIGDAQGRLEFIATLTEQAANKVLNAIDEGMPAQDKLAEQAKDVDARWAQLFAGQMTLDQFKALAGDSKSFSATVLASTEAEKARMLEIMMAQDFQDITGQLIKKIVTITAAAERELALLLRDNAPPEVKAAIVAEHPESLMNGPSLVGTAMEQTDVDDLLDSLGF